MRRSSRRRPRRARLELFDLLDTELAGVWDGRIDRAAVTATRLECRRILRAQRS